METILVNRRYLNELIERAEEAKVLTQMNKEFDALIRDTQRDNAMLKKQNRMLLEANEVNRSMVMELTEAVTQLDKEFNVLKSATLQSILTAVDSVKTLGKEVDEIKAVVDATMSHLKAPAPKISDLLLVLERNNATLDKDLDYLHNWLSVAIGKSQGVLEYVMFFKTLVASQNAYFRLDPTVPRDYTMALPQHHIRLDWIEVAGNQHLQSFRDVSPTVAGILKLLV